MNASFAANWMPTTIPIIIETGSDRSPSEIETVCNAHAAGIIRVHSRTSHDYEYENCGMLNHKTEQATGKFNWFKITLFANLHSACVRVCVCTVVCGCTVRI